MSATPTKRRGWRAGWASGALAAVLLLCPAVAPAPAVSAGESIRLTAVPTEIRSGKTIRLSGALIAGRKAPLGGEPVELRVDPFPYRGFFDASHTTTAADGSFAFRALRPDRNTRYQVRSGRSLSRPIVVYVDAPAVLHSYDRGPGRVVLTMRSYHSGYFRWIGVRAYWYVARAHTPFFHLAAITSTRELKPGLTYATATIDPPASRFVYRVCFNGAGEAGAGPPAAHPPCPRGDFLARRHPGRR